jgi:hypothetical protein
LPVYFLELAVLTLSRPRGRRRGGGREGGREGGGVGKKRETPLCEHRREGRMAPGERRRTTKRQDLGKKKGRKEGGREGGRGGWEKKGDSFV